MKKNASQRGGVANLLIIMAIGIFALSIALTIASGVAGGFSKNHNVAASSDAFYTAEAAMREGAYQYMNATTTYDGSSFAALNGVATSGVSIDTSTWPYIKVIGAADGRGSYRTVTEVFTIFPAGLAFDHAVYSEYDLSIGGSVNVNGNIFANGDINFTGNKATINGDAISASTVSQSNGGNVTGVAINNSNPIPPPAIDLAPYLAAAQATNTYFTTSSDAEAYLNGNTRNAVAYVDDNAGRTTNIQGSNTRLTGSLVVDGNLNLSGGTYSATGTYAAVVVYGNLKVSGGTTINGVLFVTGETTFGAGNNVVNGSIISVSGVDTVSLNGNVTVNFDPNIATNWRNLTGLATTTVSNPQPVQWSED